MNNIINFEASLVSSESKNTHHKEYCRAYYHKKLAADPDMNKKTWQKRKAKLIAEGKYEEYMKSKKPAVKRSYARQRHKYLQPDLQKRIAVINHLGGKCVECDYQDIRGLVLDHKRGDGYLDRKEKGGKIYRYYINHLDEAVANLQVLCANCNMIKAVENNEHNRSRRVVEDGLWQKKNAG